MLRLAVFLALLVLANAQVLLGVDYTFNIDFYRTFDSTRCDNESAWRLVSYKSLNVKVPFTSDKGIQAVGRSCTSSFPILFFNGALEFNVYLKVVSKKFRICFEVFDEHNVIISRRYYGKSSESFTPGWQKIYLRINEYVKGYIKIRGKSQKNETVLIDSFRYVPKDEIGYRHKHFKRSVTYDKEDDAEIIFKFKRPNNQYYYNADQSSAEVFPSFGYEPYADITTDAPELPNVPTDAPVIEPLENDDSIWNPLTIFLVSFGALVFLALIAVSAYHLGKLRSMDHSSHNVLAEDIEPPRTVTIPRVTGVNENRLSALRFDSSM